MSAEKSSRGERYEPRQVRKYSLLNDLASTSLAARRGPLSIEVAMVSLAPFIAV
ncbi:MAG TPA: hypothetical protein VNN08_10270 [Thermoanaerobaculia bacterium]|nr:hypothetical protein [Thermoanaerobaculia bacterium]